MTARQVFEAMLAELNNTNSPSLLLDDYNYFINKAIGMYINKRYANYDTTQQTTDDLRVLKSTAILPVTKKIITNGALNSALLETEMSSLKALLEKDKSFDAIYEVNLPSDYLHALNCLCVYEVTLSIGCYDPGNVARYAAKRLTADAWSTIVNDYYNRPTPKNPYYYIHNLNTSSSLPTNPVVFKNKFKIYHSANDYFEILFTDNTHYEIINKQGLSIVEVLLESSPITKTKLENLVNVKSTWKGSTSTIEGGVRVNLSTDNVGSNTYTITNISGTDSNSGTDPVFTSNSKIDLSNIIKVNNTDKSTIQKVAGVRYGNASTVRMEIRYGQGDVFQLKGVMVDYIKAPQYIRLTKNQMDLTEDTSLIMEFPDYVCQEIINELVKLVMANNADPRIQTVPLVSSSIVDPVRQLAIQTATAAQRNQGAPVA